MSFGLITFLLGRKRMPMALNGNQSLLLTYILHKHLARSIRIFHYPKPLQQRCNAKKDIARKLLRNC